jgi:hypothetical protein
LEVLTLLFNMADIERDGLMDEKEGRKSERKERRRNERNKKERKKRK